MSQTRTRIAHSTILAFAALILCLIPAFAEGPARPRVFVLLLHDTIQPISQEYVARGLKQAAEAHADAVLIELDTPGGLLESTRSMVHDILDSPVPVIVYVNPAGSRAASAGFFLLESADIAAMAPGTNTGAAHPVVPGTKIDDTMRQKIENDASAFLRSYVGQRSRNVAAAAEAVVSSKSYTAEEAKQLGLIDLISPTQEELMTAVDSRKIARFNGQSTALHTKGAEFVPVEQTVRELILDKLMDPNLALLILIVGALLIYLEFNTPGTIVPGALGTLLLLLALFALNLLPVRYTSVLLIAAAFVLMLLEAKFASHGVLATAGIACLVIGALTLVAGPIPELRIHTATALGAGIAFGLVTAFLVRLAVRARRNKTRTGQAALVGEMGFAMQPLSPDGQVLVHGELWRATSGEPVAKGEQVRVKGIHNLTLLVERVPAERTRGI